MAHIHKTKKNGNTYYSLRQSFRKKGKIKTKYIGYIGKNISKKKINKVLTDYKKEIKISWRLIDKNIKKHKNPNDKIKENKFFDETQMKEIFTIISNHKKKLKEKNKNKFEVNFIYENLSMDTEELEGLSKKNIQLLINSNIIPKKKGLEKVYQILNTKNILDILNKEKQLMDLRLIETISTILFKNIMFPTGYRTHDTKIWRKMFKISKAKEIKKDLRKLLKWYNKQKNKIHPLALAVLFHHKFEKIHPFYAGNGEIGRILINHILYQLEYPPLIIPSNKKKEYYSAMDKAYPNLKKDILSTDMRYYKNLMNFMHKQFVKTYWNYIV